MKAKKKNYEAPMIEVVPVEMEGVIASSGALQVMPGEQISASSSQLSGLGTFEDDVESMIETIFTVED